ncbi:MAG: hypothetical protein IPK93_03970 [Solirubrobacterales bacterium]|nr:hypothetical protein [Solirubrobacterales bacterium]
MTGRQILTWVLAALLVIAGGEVVAGALASGVTIDEPIHLLRAQGWIDFGWFSPAAFLINGEPPPATASSASVASPYVYGPVFAAIAHAANVVAGIEPSGTINDTAGSWDVRHLVSALIGFAAAVAAGCAVRAMTSSWRFGLWTAVCLLAIPLWSGMSFFNPKDLPAAAGYTLVTAGLVIALAPRSTAGARRWVRPVGIAALVGAGIFLGAGTRIAFWLPVLASLFTYAVLIWTSDRSRRDTVAVAAGVVIGIVALVAVYPVLIEHPRAFLTDSIRDSSGFPFTGRTLTAGQLLSGDPPAWYLPAWVFASIPLLIGLLALTGAALGLRGWIRELAGAGSGRLKVLAARRDIGLILVLQQLLLLSLGSIILGSSMYSGLRQHLYILPAVVMLAGFGAFRAWRRFGDRPGGSGGARAAVVVVLSLALLVPMAEGALLFPYNYTYVNPVAGIGGINGNWESDYWWSSQREAREEIPDAVVPKCSTALTQPGSLDAEITAFPCLNYRVTDPPVGNEPADADVWVIGRKRAGNAVPDYCSVEGEVTRWVRGEDVVMSYVLRCDRDHVQVVD